jgi:hypothetical protein
MSARMVGEELAREALGTAGSGPDAAAAGEKKKAEATAKKAIAEIRKEAESSGGNVLGELDTIVAGLSQDIEAIITVVYVHCNSHNNLMAVVEVLGSPLVEFLDHGWAESRKLFFGNPSDPQLPGDQLLRPAPRQMQARDVLHTDHLLQ